MNITHTRHSSSRSYKTLFIIISLFFGYSLAPIMGSEKQPLNTQDSLTIRSILNYVGLSNLQIEDITERNNEGRIVLLILRTPMVKSLPREIGLLDKLTKLYIGGTKLRTLPEEIGQLSNLEVLSVRDARLKHLPETIGQLTNLHSLNLYKNKLTRLPSSITNLAKLKRLKLGRNRLCLSTEQKIWADYLDTRWSETQNNKSCAQTNTEPQRVVQKMN